MHDLAAGLVFLLVSCVSFTLHSLAVIRLARQRAASEAEDLVGSGYVRTVSCRVLAATAYIVVAALQLAGTANLTETTLVFTCVQGLWLLNSLGDVRTRARIMPPDRHEVRLPGTGGPPPAQPVTPTNNPTERNRTHDSQRPGEGLLRIPVADHPCGHSRP